MMNCTWPYTFIEGEHYDYCGIQCPEGYFKNGTRCLDCEVPGCKVCSSVGECTYCADEGSSLFDSACHLTCPLAHDSEGSRDHPIVYDYTPVRGGARCTNECSAQNSIESMKPMTGFNTPWCRYCGEGCLNCVEEQFAPTGDRDLTCTQCEDGLYI